MLSYILKLIAILGILNSCYAQIVETKDLSVLLTHIQPHSLVVFNIDNTLIESKQTLGSQQWLDLHQQQQRNLKQALEIYQFVQQKTQVKLLDTRSPAIIAMLQESNLPTIAITSREFTLIEATIKQLASVDIFFKYLNFDHQIRSINYDNLAYKYVNGIIFTNRNNKGKCLVNFLELLNFVPHKIIVIDYNKQNLLDIEQLLPPYINFIGVRYGFLDHQQQQLQLDVATLQWELLNNIISDSEAKLLLQHRNNKTNSSY